MLDAKTLFCEAQAVTASAATTDYLDLTNGATIKNAFRAATSAIDLPDEIAFAVYCTTTVAGGTSIAFSLQTDDNTGFSSAKTLFSTAAIAVASLTQGQIVFVKIPKAKLGECERYLRGYFTVVGTPSAGAFTVGLVSGKQTNY